MYDIVDCGHVRRVKELERMVELLEGVRAEKLSLEEQLTEWRSRSQSAQQQCSKFLHRIQMKLLFYMLGLYGRAKEGSLFC